MGSGEPMSSERLAEIRKIVETVNDFYGSRLARELLAEVERLRAREAALVEELAIVGKNLDEERGYYDDDSERSGGDGQQR